MSQIPGGFGSVLAYRFVFDFLALVVFLRMISRGWILHQLGKDDWVMFAAWVCIIWCFGFYWWGWLTGEETELSASLLYILEL